ncbi:hypothetical protein [Hymenobacter cellulosivorans]|uniref:Tetratricopeptide repeat protein n=1 Tax=Hymenobacter cellulosivorans TaxID=2932249 RepID=A0ABY4F7C1_9BACT|nr:hypothetical protein [Hymenobacter cellulosivorans]UOQ51902.1 hypothetical protein MUN80_19320 [Hymenobacter cellulosivorans]
MTRASLLHILDHVGTISEAEIRELEQLAAAFPYCQTAHVLLAKAAHDQGSMLASQRLRRAATYATDRQLLRQLIEQPATHSSSPTPATVAPAAEQLVATSSFTKALPTDSKLITETTSVAAEAIAEVEEPAQDARPEAFFAPDQPELSAPAPGTGETEVLETATHSPAAPEDDTTAMELPAIAPALAAEEEAQEEQLLEIAPAACIEPEPVAMDQDILAVSEVAPQTLTPEAEPVAADEFSLPELPELSATTDHQITGEATALSAAEAFTEDQPAEALLEQASDLDSTGQVFTPSQEEEFTVELPELVENGPEEDILPAVAPPIRPPVEVGTSRFEFGLSLPEPAEQVIYELPTLEEEVPSIPVETVPEFRGDDHLGYALTGGSRYGFCLQLTDELTNALPTTEFFSPDALLQEHARRYQPTPPPTPSPFDLINKFLRNQPRLRSPAALPASAEEQADLSVRSTQGAPDIASESLAKIMIRQGKLQKAIEIYERLMMRQPEKKAYFAEQIQQLKSTE